MADTQLLAKAIAKATKEFNQEFKSPKTGPTYEGGLTATLRMLEKQSDDWLRQYIQNSTSYSNGRAKAETYLNQKMKEAGVKVENVMDPRAAQVEFNFGVKAAKEGRPRSPSPSLGLEAKTHWLAGYDSVTKAKSQARADAEDWHEEQRLRGGRR